MSRIMYILVNANGERLYQYPMTEYIDKAQQYKLDFCSKHAQGCRIATKEVSDPIASIILTDRML